MSGVGNRGWGASSEPAAPRSISRVATMDLTARARDSQPALANGLSAHNVLWAQSRPCGDGLSVRPGYVVECRVEAIRRLRNLVRESRFGPTTFRRVDTVIRTPYGPDSARWCCVTTARHGVLPSVPFSTKYEKVANVRLLVAAGLDGGASIVRHSPSRRTNYEARLVSTSLATRPPNGAIARQTFAVNRRYGCICDAAKGRPPPRVIQNVQLLCTRHTATLGHVAD